ncbi:MAG TPA: ATP-binding protein [Terriglobia bacterium]|nr:ATP-binding protein [Terriglobia bacterium]
MPEQERTTFAWTDLVWLVLLAGLALLQPIREYHKQLVLLGIGLFQIFETRLLGSIPLSRRGPYSVTIKVLLATLLVAHTGDIESSYYLIYYLPVVSAAMYFDILGTLVWTLVASLAYCSFLIPALREYQLAPGGANELAIRNLFFFPVAIVVNRFVVENRRQVWRYQKLAETLAETNRRLEQAQADARRSERLAALGQLSAGLAHEIRNPLGVIKGSAETLAKKLPSADPLAAELAGYISSEVNRLNALVSRFLDFARPLRLERRPTEIPALVDRALKSARDRWPDAKIDVERADGANLPQVPVDAELCEQVFTNLVHNAYQAMSPGGGKLRVRVASAQADGRRGVEVSFEDSGTGIAADVREQIFNPFFTTKKEGVGLGLSIVSKIVDEHRGTIQVSSEPGHGACFRVFLPAE